MTVLDLIKSSLRAIGVIASGEDPTSEESSDALEALNMLLEEWHSSELIALKQMQTFNVAASTKSYTIGSGMTWNGSTPKRVLSAYVTLSGIDYPVDIIGESEYMGIPEKTLEGRPFRLFFLPSGSTGTIYLYYQPDQAYTLTMLHSKAFTPYTSLTANITLPNGYNSALKYNLAAEISTEYKVDPLAMQLVTKRASETLAALKKSNLKKVGPMQFEGIFNKTGTYNIETDTFS